MKISTDTKIDFSKYPNIIHSTTEPFMISDNPPVLRAVVSNLTLVIKGNTEWGILLHGIRNCRFENIRIIYEGNPNICTALFLIRSGDKTNAGGPGGCHYNLFRNIELRCNGAKRGMFIHKNGTQRCNDNTFEHIIVYDSLRCGFDLKGGVGNRFFGVSVEGKKDAKSLWGIKFRRGHHNFGWGAYVENAVTPVDVSLDNDSRIYGIFERA